MNLRKLKEAIMNKISEQPTEIYSIFIIAGSTDWQNLLIDSIKSTGKHVLITHSIVSTNEEHILDIYEKEFKVYKSIVVFLGMHEKNEEFLKKIKEIRQSKNRLESDIVVYDDGTIKKLSEF